VWASSRWLSPELCVVLIYPDFYSVVIYFCWLGRTHASRVLGLAVVGFTLLELVIYVAALFSPCLLLPRVDLSWVALFYFCADALCALVHWYHSVPVNRGLSPMTIESGCLNPVAWIWIFALVDLVVAPVSSCYPNFIWLSSVEILTCALLFGLVRSYSGFFHVTWLHLWSLIWIRVWLNWYWISCFLLRFWWGVPHARDEFMKYIK
jgi:hypothetical protein